MLYLAELGPDGAPTGARVIAGGVAESIFQPEWSPTAREVIFVSDRTGWWNLYAYEVAAGTTRPLCPMAAEFGVPQWNLGMSTYAFAGRGKSCVPTRRTGSGDSRCSTRRPGCCSRSRPDLRNSARSAPTATKRRFAPAAPERPTAIVGSRSAERRTPRPQTGDRSTRPRRPAHRRLSDQRLSRWNFRPPAAKRRSACSIRRTTRIMPDRPMRSRRCWSNSRRPDIRGVQRTQSGHPVLDQPRHRGAGRELWRQHGVRAQYRDRLHLNWGIVDVDDCVNGAKFLAQRGRWTAAAP